MSIKFRIIVAALPGAAFFLKKSPNFSFLSFLSFFLNENFILSSEFWKVPQEFY